MRTDNGCADLTMFSMDLKNLGSMLGRCSGCIRKQAHSRADLRRPAL